jgi:coatomer subunit beta
MQVQNFGDILQLIIVELVYKVCRQNPAQRARFIRCIYMLLNATSPAVRYEAGMWMDCNDGRCLRGGQW